MARSPLWPKLRDCAAWIVWPFIEWFCRYPVLLVCTIGLLWLVCSGSDKNPGIGLPYLFWHHDPGVQFKAGCALAAFIAVACYVGYLLESGEPWMVSVDPRQFARLRRRYLASTIAVLATPIVLVRVLRGHEQASWLLVAGLAYGIAVCVAIGWLLGKLAEFFQSKTPHWLKPRRIHGLTASAPQLMLAIEEVHLRATLFFVVLVLLYGLFVFLDHQLVTPAMAICLLLGLTVAVYGAVVFHVHLRHAGVFIALTLVTILFNGVGSYRHRFASLDYQALVNLNDKFDKAPPVKPEDANAAWLRRQPANRPQKMIIIATSGGGLRAAAWTTAVLANLEKHIDQFPAQVHLITGASGGMLGAAYYVATLPDPGAGAPTKTSRHADPCALIDDIAQDSLSSAASELVLTDLPGSFFGGASRDRGWALEEAWERNTRCVLRGTVQSLADGESKGWRPSLVFAPMVVETGRRLYISNLDLGFLTESHGPSLNPTWDHVPSGFYSSQAAQFFTVFPDATGLRLSTAVRMNASFPYISPDGRLPTVQQRRIVDAGYYENYGIDAAVRWLYHYRKWLRDNLSGVVLVQIRDQASEQNRTSFARTEEKRPSLFYRGLSWLVTPVDAIVSARESSMSYRNDEQVSFIANELNVDDQDNFFETVVFELTKPSSLNWYLTPNEIETIKSNMQDDIQNSQRSEKLKGWLAEPGRPKAG